MRMRHPIIRSNSGPTGKNREQTGRRRYVITQDAGQADYVALVSYGIGEGKTSDVTTPIFGQTSGGSTYSSGTVYGSGGPTTYSGSTYTMPTNGVIGSRSSTSTTYTRPVAIDNVDGSSLRSGKPGKIYEMRARSTGTCSVITEVFDEILEAMFHDFPGENGKANHQCAGYF
jgi:hypothetical protein